MIDWWRQRSLFMRLLAYALAVFLLFVLAASIGAVTAMVISDDLSWPAGERAKPEAPSSAGERGMSPRSQQANADRSQQDKAGSKREQAAPQDEQTTYVDEVGDIQADAVEAFLDSHKRLLRYDAITSGDVEKMQADQAALKRYADRASALDAPEKYREHKDTFLSAIDELHRAARLAYVLAVDPISASEADFDHYDHLLNEAAADLQRSNEILGHDYKTIEGVQGVSTSQ
jgi:hypothetical protein